MKKTHKLLSLLLALMLVLPMLAPVLALNASAEESTGWDGVSVATRFAKGSGTSSNPYRIENAEQLAYMAKLLNDPSTAVNYYKKYFLLTADIDLGGKEWTPISNTTYNPQSGTYRFAGSFNGGGYTISNLYIGKNYAAGTGLFGITQGATIKNLTLQGRVEGSAAYVTAGNAAPGAAMLAPVMFSTTVQNVTIYADMDIKTNEYPGQLHVGVFCGYTGISTTPTKLDNCHAYGTLAVSVAHGGNTTVGGLVSHSKAVTINNSSSDVDIYVKNGTVSGVAVGGILGDNYSDKDQHTTHVTTITGCTYTGNIHTYANGHTYVGGILGLAGRHNSATTETLTYGGTLTIKSCAFDGTIHSDVSDPERDNYKGAMIGVCRATVATLEDFFTTSTEVLYHKDPALIERGAYGTEITLNDNGGHVTGIGLTTELGASVRLTTGSSGLRFTSMIDRTLYKTLTERTDLTVQLGTLIAPTTYVEGAGGFAFDKLLNYQKKMGHSAPYLDVPFVLGTHTWLDSKYSNAEAQNLHYFSGAIANILEKNYNRSFSGVGYLTITTADGYELTFYGDYNDAARARTVSYVATRALNDLSDTKTTKYAYEMPDGKFSPYSPAKRTKLDVFASKYDSTTVVTTPIELIKDGKSEYSIVYPLGGDAKDRDLAIYLQQVIRTLTGVSLPVYESYVQTGVDAKEIVVGCNERAGTYHYGLNSLDNGYRIFTDNERVVLLGDTPQALGTAVRTFVKNFFGVDITTQVSGKAYETVTVPRAAHLQKNGISTAPLNINLSSLKITYTSSNEIEKRMAYRLRDAIAVATGGKIEYATSTVSSKNYLDRTLVGGTQLTVSPLSIGARIQLSTNSALKDGDFKISTTASGSAIIIKVEAGSYYGFEGAKNYILAESLYGIAPLTTSGFKTTGNFEYWLNRLEESSKYAYNQMGDARVMFYNVLFNPTATGGSSVTMEVPMAERNRLQAQMIAQYMPDVLGCQEFNLSKRDTAGSDNLATLLANLGYVEAIDPIVDNASQSKYWLGAAVKDANGKLIGYKPGNGKAVGYAVDASKYGFSHTYYNNTPLFYNSNTTKLITAEYYWYENQWDLGELVTDSYGTYYPTTHENGAGDCGSKAATWGLFEDLECGNQYIVITTHMCTRSDKIRGLQAQELSALITQLTAQYNVPVFLGGDMNGTMTSQNIQHFLYEAKYTDAMFSGISKHFTAHLNTSHGYPDLDTVDTNVTMMQPSGQENTYFNDNVIDRIFLHNHSSITAQVFGIISDDCTRSSSDHYPIFMDFSFNKKVNDPSSNLEWTERY